MNAETFGQFVGRCVVLDTAGPMVYIGRLESCGPLGFWLVEADVHSRDEGHATNEQYINDACLLERSGVRNVNRARVFVFAAIVHSISALDEVIAEGSASESGSWME